MATTAPYRFYRRSLGTKIKYPHRKKDLWFITNFCVEGSSSEQHSSGRKSSMFVYSQLVSDKPIYLSYIYLHRSLWLLEEGFWARDIPIPRDKDRPVSKGYHLSPKITLSTGINSVSRDSPVSKIQICLVVLAVSEYGLVRSWYASNGPHRRKIVWEWWE